MNARLSKILLALLLLASLSSCDKPTYSKEKTEESVIKLCKDEYGLDVEVKIIGDTLGVSMPIEGLVDPDLKLNQDAGKEIEDVALSIHRVVTSTDRPLKFYTFTARDTNVPGAEFVLTGFVYDVVRVRLLDISRGEYHKRILRDFKFNPVVTGEKKIRELFEALKKDSPLIQNIKPVFYPIYAIGETGTQNIGITEIDSKEISAQEALFYIKTKESYTPLPQFEAYRTIFPPGFENEYLMLVNISVFPNPVQDIASKYFYSGNEIRQRDLRETFDQYHDIGYIGADGMPKKDLRLDWFLSQQIARRIKISFEEDKKLKEGFAVSSSEGNINNKIFSFEFSIVSNNPANDGRETILSEIIKVAATVLHSYYFEDFDGVSLISVAQGGLKIYISKEDLEKFRKNKIKIRDIIKS